MTKLDLNPTHTPEPVAPDKSIKGRFMNAYDKLAGSGDYQRNQGNLRIIQLCVITVSALATGWVNAFAHQERLGLIGSLLLAVLIAGFVEKFFFTLRHGLTTTYKAGKQRTYAQMCYRVIQLTMVLNVAVLTAWIVGLYLPPYLQFWYNWSIVVHFALALIGVTAVRDSDSVTENNMLELKAATARQDIVTIRKAAAIGNPVVLMAARVRGLMDAMGMAWKLLWRKPVTGNDYLEQLDDVAKGQFEHIDGRAGMAQWPNEISPDRLLDDSPEIKQLKN